MNPLFLRHFGKLCQSKMMDEGGFPCSNILRKGNSDGV